MSDPRPGRWWPRFKAWWRAHHHRLMSIEASPHAIALGLAIGIYFGFTPLWSLKTLLSIGIAWLFNSNKIAAALGVTLHDVILPFMPAIFLWEYKCGYYVLHGTMPARMHLGQITLQQYLHWNVFVNLIWPTLVGSLLLALPPTVVSYFLVRALIRRRRAHRPLESVAE